MFLDTSIIIEVFRRSEGERFFNQLLEIAKEEETYVSVVQLAEIADWCVRNSILPKTG